MLVFCPYSSVQCGARTDRPLGSPQSPEMICPLFAYKFFSEERACGFLPVLKAASDLMSLKGSPHPLPGESPGPAQGLQLLMEKQRAEPFPRLSSLFMHLLNLFSQHPSGFSVIIIPIYRWGN